MSLKNISKENKVRYIIALIVLIIGVPIGIVFIQQGNKKLEENQAVEEPIQEIELDEETKENLNSLQAEIDRMYSENAYMKVAYDWTNENVHVVLKNTGDYYTENSMTSERKLHLKGKSTDIYRNPIGELENAIKLIKQGKAKLIKLQYHILGIHSYTIQVDDPEAIKGLSLVDGILDYEKSEDKNSLDSYYYVVNVGDNGSISMFHRISVSIASNLLVWSFDGYNELNDWSIPQEAYNENEVSEEVIDKVQNSIIAVIEEMATTDTDTADRKEGDTGLILYNITEDMLKEANNEEKAWMEELLKIETKIKNNETLSDDEFDTYYALPYINLDEETN